MWRNTVVRIGLEVQYMMDVLFDLYLDVFSKFFLAAVFLFAVSILCFFVLYLREKKQYEKTEYYIQTKNTYQSVRTDTGRIGEYYICKYLDKLEGYRKYLFNVYLPKEDGETTELDVILLHESGIYVFESKNYSGWIFGNEAQRYWTQSLKKNKKSKFFNPIIQNKVHLKWLEHFLAEPALPVYSYIVFSDRCELKNVTLTSGNHCVIKRCDILETIRKNAVAVGKQLSSEEIDTLYKKLYPLTQVDEIQKLKHIEDVQQKQQNKVVQRKKEIKNTDDLSALKCPRCGGELVIRVAAKGEHKGQEFLGCSNYPKCRYIRNISEEQQEENQQCT